MSAASSGCTDRVSVYLSPPWSKDQLVVLTMLDAFGSPRDSKPGVYLDVEQIELELPEGVASRVLARAYPRTMTGPDGSPASSCDISVNGAEPLPAAENTWVTAAIDQDTTEVSFDRDDADYAKSAPLGFAACPPIRDCSAYRATLVEAPPHIRTSRVAVIDAAHAYFGGRPEEENMDDPMILGRIEGAEITLLPEIDELRGSPEDFVWAPGEYFWIVAAAIPYRYTRDFSPLPQPRITRIRTVNVGRDGTTYLVNKSGEVLIPTDSSTTGYVRDLLAPPDTGRMAVVRRDRVFVEAAKALWRFDGSEWVKEHDINLLENVSTIAADDEVAVVAGEIENVRVRNESTGDWDEKLERPFDGGLRLRASAAVGAGRFIVAGDSGAVAVWTGSHWCPLAYTTAVTLVDIAVDPTKTVAYLAGDADVGPMGQTILVRVDMPAP